MRALSRRSIICLTIGLALAASSNTFGRGHPGGDYRPVLPADALSNGCHPLPRGIEMPFPYQVRSDQPSPSDGQRRLVLQFDLVDEHEARAAFVETMSDAGFEVDDAGELVRFRRDRVVVSAQFSALPDLTVDSIVRGTLVLDVPETAARSTSPACSDPFSTKRFETTDGPP